MNVGRVKGETETAKMERRQSAERVIVTAHGTVQGVFFRHSTRLQADRLGVVGTVENRPDGTVRVVAEGSRRQLEELVEWLREGPDAAWVERVDVSWTEGTGSHSGFRILR
jgi:acylphosphatase